ncbi:MAG: hypothetical protein M5U09_29285 [Gammaproteobacteria bacterium]|nr:hypothetical protein [Gammaproteobacteria bacterium]
MTNNNGISYGMNAELADVGYKLTRLAYPAQTILTYDSAENLSIRGRIGTPAPARRTRTPASAPTIMATKSAAAGTPVSRSSAMATGMPRRSRWTSCWSPAVAATATSGRRGAEPSLTAS